MAQPVSFDGANTNARAPAGDEDRIGIMPVFRNGKVVVSCWQLSDEDLEEITRTGRVFVAHISGQYIIPTLIGTADNVREMCVDFGGTFPKQKD